jgi:hypothetical protein
MTKKKIAVPNRPAEARKVHVWQGFVAMRGLVIVRDFRGEPLRRVALFTDMDAVYTASVFAVEANLGYPPPTAVPRRDTFQWDDAIYARLKAQWREHAETDNATWKELKPFSGDGLNGRGGGGGTDEQLSDREPPGRPALQHGVGKPRARKPGAWPDFESRTSGCLPPARRIGHAAAFLRVTLERKRFRIGEGPAGAAPL